MAQLCADCVEHASLFKDEQSQLIHSAVFGHDKWIAELIKAGADVNKKDKYGKPVLMHAAENGRKNLLLC